jgi:hypothetical protein
MTSDKKPGSVSNIHGLNPKETEYIEHAADSFFDVIEQSAVGVNFVGFVIMERNGATTIHFGGSVGLPQLGAAEVLKARILEKYEQDQKDD